MRYQNQAIVRQKRKDQQNQKEKSATLCVLCASMMVVLLSACGQKGALYLPKQETAKYIPLQQQTQAMSMQPERLMGTAD